MEKTKTRNSNLELLRIITMIIIVAHHYALHGFYLDEIKSVFFNKYVLDFLSLGGKLGVCIFIFISGYFMVNSKFTIKKLWKLIGQVFFYSFGITVVFLTALKPLNPIDIKTIIKSIFPISYSVYWFMTSFVMLMIISPYLNKFIHNLTRIELRNFIVLMIFLWSIFATFTKADLAFNNLGWFIVLYCISAYIRLYVKFDEKNIYINKIVLLGSMLLLILSSVAMNYLGSVTGVMLFIENSRYFSNMNSIIVLVLSISIFMFFCSKKSYNNNFVNELAKYTLGVYLIHDNWIFRPYLWQKILRTTSFYTSKYLIVHAIISIACVYIGCTIIDLLRAKLIEPIWMKLYYVIERKVKKTKMINKLIDKYNNRVEIDERKEELDTI